MVSVRRLAAAIALSTLAAGCASGETTSTTGVATTPPTSAAPSTTPTTGEPATSTSAPPSSTTAATTSESVYVGAYSFPPGTVNTAFRPQPSRVEGVIGIPAGPGPFPIAVFLHGLSFDCTGLAGLDPEAYVTTEWAPPCTLDGSRYLRNAFAGTAIVEHLAKRDVIGVAIDVNAGYFWWGGEARDQDVIDPLIVEHLAIIEDLAAGELKLDGYQGSFAIDGSSYALIGHSRGGSFTEARLAPSLQDPPFSSPEPDVAVLVGSAGFFDDVQLVVPLLNLRAACDADVGSDAGEATAQTMAGRGAEIVLDAEVLGSSHWGMTSYSYGVSTEGCDVIDPETTESHVAQLVAGFVSGAFDGDMSLPVDDAVISLTTITGASPPIVAPAPPSGLRPRDVPITEFDQERLPPIDPDAPFTDESQTDDI